MFRCEALSLVSRWFDSGFHRQDPESHGVSEDVPAGGGGVVWGVCAGHVEGGAVTEGAGLQRRWERSRCAASGSSLAEWSTYRLRSDACVTSKPVRTGLKVTGGVLFWRARSSSSCEVSPAERRLSGSGWRIGAALSWLALCTALRHGHLFRWHLQKHRRFLPGCYWSVLIRLVMITAFCCVIYTALKVWKRCRKVDNIGMNPF